MRNAILVAAFALAVGAVGSTTRAHAQVCQWGNWGNSTNVQGSFTSSYSTCSSPSSWAGVFTARVWMHPTCQLGSGCKNLRVQRDNLCVYPGIGTQARGNRFNTSTGVVQTNVAGAITNQTYCGTPIQSSQSGSWWWTTGQCRIAWGCP